jgi:1,4-alpha-glucan branching enzyme
MRYTPFYDESPWPERFEAGWHNIPTEQRKEFIRLSVEHGYKKDYYASLEWLGVEGPDWEDLSDEQRENIRAESRRYAQDMHAFGQALAQGTELPELNLK